MTPRSGIRLTWDTVETVQTFDPDYQPSSGSSTIGLAFPLDTPAEVHATYEKLVAAGYHGDKPPWELAEQPFEDGSKAVPACSRLLQAVPARTKSASSCATVLLVTPRVSTVLQQILQHVGVADAIAVSDAADAGRRQIAVC